MRQRVNFPLASLLLPKIAMVAVAALFVLNIYNLILLPGRTAGHPPMRGNSRLLLLAQVLRMVEQQCSGFFPHCKAL
jgi:hypothetical protein